MKLVGTILIYLFRITETPSPYFVRLVVAKAYEDPGSIVELSAYNW